MTQGDYPALKAAIEGVAGIQSVSLLIDGQVPADVGADQRARLFISAQLRNEDTPQPE